MLTLSFVQPYQSQPEQEGPQKRHQEAQVGQDKVFEGCMYYFYPSVLGYFC